MDKVFNLSIKAGFFLLLFVAPLSLDIALVRYKLWIIEIATLWLITIWLLRAISEGKIQLKKTALNLPILTCGFLILGFWLLAPERTVAQDEFIRMLLCLGLYFIALNETENYDFIFKIWFISTFLICLYGIGQIFGFHMKLFKWDISIPHCSRVMSTSGNPLFFAAYLVILFPLVFTTLIKSLEKNLRSLKLNSSNFIFILLLGILLILMSVNLFYTKCRGGWLGWGVSILILGYFVFKRYNWFAVLKRKKSFLITGIFCMLVAGGVFAWKTRAVWQRPTDRLLIWRDSLQMVKEHPLFGGGIGRYHLEFRHSPELLKRIPRDKFIVNYAHNEFLEVLCETGIIGFGIFLWLYLLPFISARKITSSPSNQRATLPLPVIGVLSSEAGLLIHNFFGVNMRFIVSAAYLFFTLGILGSYTSQPQHHPVRAKQLSPIWKIAFASLILVGFVFCFKQVLKPWLAHRAVASEKSFFEEKKGEPAELAKIRQQIRQNPQDANVYYRLGWYFAKEKRFPEAIENFQKALQINPNLSGAYNNLGNIYYFTGRRDLAIKNYEKAIKLNPGLADAHFNLGYLYYLQGWLKEAAREFNLVLKLDPDNPKASQMLKKMVE